MEPKLFDCEWCGSARSIEHGLCQVCLMEYPGGASVTRLPVAPRRLRTVPLTEHFTIPRAVRPERRAVE